MKLKKNQKTIEKKKSEEKSEEKQCKKCYIEPINIITKLPIKFVENFLATRVCVDETSIIIQEFFGEKEDANELNFLFNVNGITTQAMLQVSQFYN